MRQAIAKLGLSAAEYLLSADAAYALAARLASAVLRGAGPRLERATAEAFPERDARWVARAVREQLHHRAWLALDKRTLGQFDRDALFARVDGLASLRCALDAALDAGRGAVVYSIHFGRPLVVPPLLAKLELPCTRLVAPRAAGLDPESIVVGLDETKDAMLGALARNRVLSVLVDTPLARQTAAAPFLSARLPVAVGLAWIVRESGAALVAVTTRSAAPLRFALDACRVEVPPEGASPEEVGAALLAPFERTVAEHPGGWYGANRVFRARTFGFPPERRPDHAE